MHPYLHLQGEYLYPQAGLRNGLIGQSAVGHVVVADKPGLENAILLMEKIMLIALVLSLTLKIARPIPVQVHM